VQNREEISHQKVMISPTVYTRTMLPHYLVKNNSCDVDRMPSRPIYSTTHTTHQLRGSLNCLVRIRLRNDRYCVGWGVKLYSLP